MEVIDAGMFQEAVQDTDYPDMLTDSGHARPQAADAPGDQVYLYSGL
jgi:hypothetical protein